MQEGKPGGLLRLLLLQFLKAPNLLGDLRVVFFANFSGVVFVAHWAVQSASLCGAERLLRRQSSVAGVLIDVFCNYAIVQ